MGSKFKIFGIYSDGMVLQQNTKNCIYGEGEINKKVMINFRKKTYSTKINSSGKWKIEFNPEKAGGPFELSVICDDNEIVFHDVYVGEVWLLSGQSNAQLPMQRLKYSFPHDVTLPENNNIRMITVPINYSFDGLFIVYYTRSTRL